jgi:hypothetical protein
MAWLAIAGYGNRMYYGIDDATIASIVNGTLTGVPDPHGIFISTVLGGLIAGLSKLIPSVGWYGVIVWMILTIGIAGGALAIIAVLPDSRRRLLPAAALMALTAPLLFRLTFTTISIVAGGMSFLLLFAAARATSSRSRFLLSWAVVLAIASIALRDHGFGAAALVMAPVTCAAMYVNWRRAIVFIASLAAASALILGLDIASYSSPEWSEFRAFSSAASEVIDFSQVNPDDGRKAAGWSKNDAEVFLNYSFFDPDIHGAAKVGAYAAATKPAMIPPDMAAVLSGGGLWVVLSVITLIAGILPARRDARRWWSWRLLGLFMVVWTTSATSVVGLWRFQWRVSDGMMGVGLVAALVLIAMSWPSTAEARWTRIWTVYLVAAVIPFGAVHLVDRGGLFLDLLPDLRATVMAPNDDQLRDFIDSFPELNVGDLVLLGEANAIPVLAADPLTRDDIWESLPYQASGWPAFSPVWWERSRQLGVDNAPTVLVDNQNVLYLTYRHGSEQRMQLFLMEHYGVHAVPCEQEIPGLTGIGVRGSTRKAWRFVTESKECS